MRKGKMRRTYPKRLSPAHLQKAPSRAATREQFEQYLSWLQGQPATRKFLESLPVLDRAAAETLLKYSGMRSFNLLNHPPYDPRTAPLISLFLRDPDPRTRENAIRALAALNAKSQVPFIKKLAQAEQGTRRTLPGQRSPPAFTPEDAAELRMRKTARQALSILSTKPGDHLLYSQQDPAFFNKERGLMRKEFRKTGGRLTLLGGRLAGKAIARILPFAGFEAWKKAFEAGIPVEPLLKRKNGSYRMKLLPGGKVRVFSRVLGPNAAAFFMVRKNEKYKGSFWGQVHEITTRLVSEGILNTNLEEDDFCIAWKGKGRERKPKAILIDFDKAEML